MFDSYYFAARYSRHPEMRVYRDELTTACPGALVTSRWIDCHGGHQVSSFLPERLNADPESCWPLGEHDLADIRSSDVVVSFTGAGGKGGRHVEFGYGLALGRRMVVIGAREHIFHTSPVVQRCATWAEFLAVETARSLT